MNTRELVGASCIVSQDYTDLFLPDRLWKVEVNQELVNPHYFIKSIQIKPFRDEISKWATGTSGSMLNLSQEKFMNLRFLLPPKELQDDFAEKIIAIERLKQQMQQQLQKLEENFQSLLHQAFSGQIQVQSEGEIYAAQR